MLTGQTALVTGASRGIGAAIALKLASRGADIAIIYAGNSAAAEETAEKCAALGVTARCYKCNVADFAEAKATVAAVKADFGGVNILVNNAGINRDGLIAMMRESDFDDVISTNLKGAFNMIRHCTPMFIRAKGGCIINISSVAGVIGNAGQTNYAASKAGLLGLTKSVARELAPKNVRCNAIAPGFVQTDMTKEFDDSNPMVASIPLGRMGTPEDIAACAAFLADEGSYITGQTLCVDGGLAM
ncbi:MAG: 3-oxoacyl-[acyl-carrier-protein] reductase [Oscillospiraceae bacterium]|nr:3-oxoacyl-[acyl-carrier-protein] reductase [Oscillospiraceae bacterium]MCC8080020.1 3-oxoacyl-[acyl-carrier-protein] reductase [Oscillospiraceae bacterium]MCD7792729.1 3-oxoacyl-[acyl-carrier-protein] reductase [Oscillospiraceae bacterium]MCD8099801.1 3-oxoacyl-[acyl-carrier-protein] reductase [Oscillospiraceae bacterium]MCD8254211.1 3-oxoacyl-[acyl-carrier-protein] reductase [Oscillospiraceae bacterium]